MSKRRQSSRTGFSSSVTGAGFALLAAGIAGLLAGCPQGRTGGAPDAARYQQMVSAFYTGVVALRANDPERARTQLLNATTLYPEEPAAWANLAIQYLRGQQLVDAGKALDKALALAPGQPEVLLIAAQVENARGNAPKAAEYVRQVLQKEPNNLKAHALLIQQLERQPSASDAETQAEYEQVLAAQPGNLAALLELTRLAAKEGDRSKLLQRLRELKSDSGTWPPEPQQRLQALLTKSTAADPKACAPDVQMLANVLRVTPQYQTSSAVLGRGGKDAGTPIERFLKLPQPPHSPASPDTALTFTATPSGRGQAAWAAGLQLQPAAPPRAEPAAGGHGTAAAPPADPPPSLVYPSGSDLVLGNDGKTRKPLPGGAAAIPTARQVLAVDWNDDYRPDLVVASTHGLRFLRQQAPGNWIDVTATTRLPQSLLSGSYQGAWALDFDLDGDLDVLVGGAKQLVGLQNNGDGSWKATVPFAGVAGLRDFAWADFNGDGVPDAAVLDGAGKLSVFLNQRAGHFRRAELGGVGGTALSLSVADSNWDGTLDLTVLRPGGVIEALSHTPDDKWQATKLATWSGAPSTGPAVLLWGDLDNNGAVDLVASSGGETQVWLGDATGALQPLPARHDARISSMADVDSDGRLDLIGVTGSGQPVVLFNHGAKNYGWQVLRPRNAHVREGDQKINAFGVGGEAETRAGLLVQKLPISGPQVHFGLGTYPKADAVRITWPNGQAQGEFDLAANSAPLANQRLTGSCPWLFADDGHGMKFVTDVLWKSPLGLRINAQVTAGVSQTLDWVKVRGDQLQPRDGYYNLRVTAELWETDFFDHASLMVVDHPSGTELVVDERFAIPQPELKLHLAQTPLPISRATDQDGLDVTGVVAARDGRYLDTFRLGRYQGVARDHFVEVEVPEAAPRTGGLWLLANGWVFPTDSSINVALGQGSQEKPQGLNLEIPDGHGGWKVARTGLGFPAGKYKTVRLDLTGLFAATGPRRLRLRTNMEIYWDELSVASPAGATSGVPRTRTLLPDSADLRTRGFSTLLQPRRSSPETPQYERLAGTYPMWLDLEGYYTRFGDVRELLRTVDDRYVIMNAGDELALRFRAPAAPPAGWTRDFVFVSDGWDKDGNFNTTWSQTVLPLPSHSRPAYDRAPGPLHTDPVFRAHAKDWATYQTRYVTPAPFRNALRPLP